MVNLFAAVQGKRLPPGFHWLNEPAQWTFTDRGLVVQAEQKTDYFIDPAGTGVKTDGHFLYTEFQGDFTLSTFAQVDMEADFDAAVLLVMVDEANWGKLCYEYSSRRPMIVSVVTRPGSLSDDCNSLAVPQTGIHLRITRFGPCFAFHYSHDGAWWELVRYFRMESEEPVKVGVVAQSPTGNGCQVIFQHLTYSPEPVTEIRSGK